MAGNISEVIILILGLGFQDADGLSVYPLSTIQILWINMVTSTPPALGLACEEAEPDIMQRPPVEKGKLLLNWLVAADTAMYGGLIGIIGLVNFIIVSYIGSGVDLHLTHGCNHDSADCMHVFKARATCFATTTILLLLHAYNCKVRRPSCLLHFSSSHPPTHPPTHPPLPPQDLSRRFFTTNWTKHPKNKFLFYAVAVGIVTLLPTFYVPQMQKVFYHAPIDWEWGLVVGGSLIFILASEAYKVGG